MAEGRMWSTTDNARWFAIPAEIGIDGGDLVIRDLLGRRKNVDPDALMPFEVSGDTAKILVRRQMLDLLSQADAGLESLRSLVPADRPEGAAGLDVMRKALTGIVTGLRQKEDPPPRKYAAEDLATRFEGWLRKVADDPDAAQGLTRFTDELHAMAQQLKPSPLVTAVHPAAAREAASSKKAAKKPTKKAPKKAGKPGAAEAPPDPTD